MTRSLVPNNLPGGDRSAGGACPERAEKNFVLGGFREFCIHGENLVSHDYPGNGFLFGTNPALGLTTFSREESTFIMCTQ